jgi:hypothetical protein
MRDLLFALPTKNLNIDMTISTAYIIYVTTHGALFIPMPALHLIFLKLSWQQLLILVAWRRLLNDSVLESTQ